MQPALHGEPRRSRGVWGPSLAENAPKTGPKVSGQTAYRYVSSVLMSLRASQLGSQRGSLPGLSGPSLAWARPKVKDLCQNSGVDPELILYGATGLGIGLRGGLLVQPALQDEPRRSRGFWGPGLAENLPKT